MGTQGMSSTPRRPSGIFLVHSKAFVSVLKNGKHLSITLETNLLRAATLLFKFYTSLMFFGGVISNMAWILSGLASTPHYDTMKPRNVLNDIPNTYLLGLSFMSETKGLKGHPGNDPPLCSLPTCCPRTPGQHLDILSNLLDEHHIHKFLIRCSRIL